MNNAFRILFTLLYFYYVSALTNTEVRTIRERNSKRKCGGYIDVAVVGDKITIKRDVTPDHMWGCTNPNVPTTSPKTITLDNDPKIDEDGPYCLPMGDIGIALNGISFFNPLAAGGRNAVDGDDQEIFDCCGGHTAPDGVYHYHKLPVGGGCDNPIFDTAIEEMMPQFLGIALDGFPIYGQWDGLNKDDLDECHGTYIPDEETGSYRYAYIAVADHFPYIMGCFKGKPVRNSQKCSNTVKDHLCACNYGDSLSYADVTSNVDDSKQTTSIIGTSEINLMLNDDSCHNDQCIKNEGWNYNNGQCESPNGGGGDRPTTGPNGGGDKPTPGPNYGGDKSTPEPNDGGNKSTPEPNDDEDRPTTEPNGGDDTDKPTPGPNCPDDDGNGGTHSHHAHGDHPQHGGPHHPGGHSNHGGPHPHHDHDHDHDRGDNSPCSTNNGNVDQHPHPHDDKHKHPHNGPAHDDHKPKPKPGPHGQPKPKPPKHGKSPKPEPHGQPKPKPPKHGKSPKPGPHGQPKPKPPKHGKGPKRHRREIKDIN